MLYAWLEIWRLMSYIGLFDSYDETTFGEIVGDFTTSVLIHIVSIDSFGTRLHQDSTDTILEEFGTMVWGQRSTSFPFISLLFHNTYNSIASSHPGSCHCCLFHFIFFCTHEHTCRMLNYDDWFNSMSILYTAELVVVVVYERSTHAQLVLQRKRFHAKNSSKKQTRDKRKRKEDINMERWGTRSAKGGYGEGNLVNIHVECSIR